MNSKTFVGRCLGECSAFTRSRETERSCKKSKQRLENQTKQLALVDISNSKFESQRIERNTRKEQQQERRKRLSKEIL